MVIADQAEQAEQVEQAEEKDEQEVESELEIITIETPSGAVDINVSSAEEYKRSKVRMDMYGDSIPAFKNGKVVRKALEVGRKEFGLARPALEGFEGFQAKESASDAPTDRAFTSQIIINGANS